MLRFSPPQGVGDHHVGARFDGVRFPETLPARDVDVEQMHLAVDRRDRSLRIDQHGGVVDALGVVALLGEPTEEQPGPRLQSGRSHRAQDRPDRRIAPVGRTHRGQLFRDRQLVVMPATEVGEVLG